MTNHEILILGLGALCGLVIGAVLTTFYWIWKSGDYPDSHIED